MFVRRSFIRYLAPSEARPLCKTLEKTAHAQTDYLFDFFRRGVCRARNSDAGTNQKRFHQEWWPVLPGEAAARPHVQIHDRVRA